MSKSLNENKLTKLAIERLKRLGFSNVDANTLLEDEVYRSYYVKMLQEISNQKRNWENTITKILERIGESKY